MYATGLDSKDWSLWRSIFTPEVAVLFHPVQNSGFQGALGHAWTTMSRDEWVSGRRELFTGLGTTQHMLSNPVIEVDGDTAQCTIYMRAIHFYQDEIEPYTIGGYYTDQLVRTGEGWKISSVNLNVTWQTGDPAMLDRAREHGRKLLAQ